MYRVGLGCFLAVAFATISVLPVAAGWRRSSTAAPATTASPTAPSDTPAYTVSTPPYRQPYYFVPQKVEAYPYYGGVPAFRWGYFGATRHEEAVGPHVPYNNGYRDTTYRYGD